MILLYFPPKCSRFSMFKIQKLNYGMQQWKSGLVTFLTWVMKNHQMKQIRASCFWFFAGGQQEIQHSEQFRLKYWCKLFAGVVLCMQMQFQLWFQQQFRSTMSECFIIVYGCCLFLVLIQGTTQVYLGFNCARHQTWIHYFLCFACGL